MSCLLDKRLWMSVESMCFGIANRKYNVVQCFREKSPHLRSSKFFTCCVLLFRRFTSMLNIFSFLWYCQNWIFFGDLKISCSRLLFLQKLFFARFRWIFIYLSGVNTPIWLFRAIFWRSCNCVIDFVCKLISIFHWKDRCLYLGRIMKICSGKFHHIY